MFSLAMNSTILSSSSIAADTTPIVQTDKGAVQGIVANGVENFLDIPYAAPPVGALRWAAPRQAARWSGVLATQSYGTDCPQLAGSDSPSEVLDEDCLSLNVQRPVGTRSSDKLPVFVYIHGGTNAGGGSLEQMYRIVGATPVIALSLNYRLGTLGFLALPSVATHDGQEDGNYGFQDQQAALRWVQRNIANFGGDPTKVTIGGESFGGLSVCYHLVAPGSKGLFSQAILQSGSCETQALPQAQSLATGVADSLGCTDAATQGACMREQSVADLLAAQPAVVPPVRGTLTIPVEPTMQVARGDFARVPILIGGNRDEGRTFAGSFIGYNPTQFTSLLTTTFGPNAEKVLRHYPYPVETSDPSAVAYRIAAVIGDAGAFASAAVELGFSGCATSLLTSTYADYTKVYAYEFSDRTGPGAPPLITGYVQGAGHGAELPYLYIHDNSAALSLFRPEDTRLSDQMVRYWGAFIRNGDPNVAGQAQWPQFNGTDSLLQLRPGVASAAISLSDDRQQHRCAFWDTLAGAPVTGQLPAASAAGVD